MRKLRRILFNVLTAFSVLLCVASIGLWIRSYLGRDELCYERQGIEWSVSIILGSGSGELGFKWLRCPGTFIGQSMFEHHWTTPATRFSNGIETQLGGVIVKRRLGIGWWAFDDQGLLPMSGRAFFVPCGYVAAITSLLPLLWLRKSLRRKVHPNGRCRRCGYDLRATPDRCPECGTRPIAQGPL